MPSDDRMAFERNVDVSRETIDRFAQFAETLKKWNRKINLVSSGTIDAIWSRHFLDSAQIFELAPATAIKWTDIGSGGGFPGLVVAILAKEKRPDLTFSLIESDIRKSVFLSTIARDLSLNVQVIAQRIEDAAPQCADIVSARALAPLDVLMRYADRHGKVGGAFLFQKGASYQTELTAARESWHMDCDVIPSITDPNSAILMVKGYHSV